MSPGPVLSRAYAPGSWVLSTTTAAPSGRRVEVVDFMSAAVIVRLVRSVAGPAKVVLDFRSGGRRVDVAEGRLVSGDIEVRCATATFAVSPRGREEGWSAVLTLGPGEEVVATIGPAGEAPALSPDGAHRLLEETLSRWRGWIGTAAADGPFAVPALRGLLSMKVLAGGGAGTLSMPRRAGGDRTADNRWVHLRGVAEAARVYAGAGLADDTEAAETWLRQVLADAPIPWPAWLDLDGQPVPEEEELPWSGFRRSQPVRLGRSEPGVDLGLLGSVVAAVGSVATGPAARRGDAGPLSAAWPALAAMADWVCDHWRPPDAGWWGAGPPLRTWTSSRLRAWSGLDHMVRLARAADPLDLAAVPWQQEAAAVARWLADEAVAPDGGLALSGAPETEPDSSLLACAWSGPWPADHPVVHATVDRVLGRLGDGAFLHRFSERVADGREGPDSPDLEATLMAVRALAALERWDEAHERMEAVVSSLGPLLLPASVVDPVSRQPGGDFPNFAVAAALVRAAQSLAAGPL